MSLSSVTRQNPAGSADEAGADGHKTPTENETTQEDTMTTIEMAPLLREDLTKRERVVLAHLTEETTLDDIARRLFVTRNTVKSQVRSAYRKLGVSTRAEAVDRARELGLQ
ncbi:hypothetical protein GCM10011331_10670 [Flavimobilis marinus]|uniref:response regulator transcription factor n=1 Tax=Flavimobilis marinus TaxID=285351 RepID=UPI00199AE898|nr:LuxR C-terminal-related transcriptional regulator [Flavimobilis marinus]GHG48708.1 hypothetical protein GCM10011331_10670 [Flavimobilis marinus]